MNRKPSGEKKPMPQRVYEAYQQGAREFAEWLISHSMLCDSLGQDISDYYDDNNKAIEAVLSEWQKGAENDIHS